MKLLWLALLGICRAVYLAYTVWCWLFSLALLGFMGVLPGWWDGQTGVGQLAARGVLLVLVLLALFAIVYIHRHRTPDNPNPWQSAFLAWFGTLKLFSNPGGSPEVQLHWPSKFLVENPRGYHISGTDTRQILNLLQPGDILLRGYEGYVDGMFIRRSSLSAGNDFQPGWFTHVALYMGEIVTEDAQQVPVNFQQRGDFFETGPQQVIHAMAKGVHTQDILAFLRCDYLCVLRLPEQITPPRAQVISAMRSSALQKIGEEYDFDCSDTQAFDRFSCAELLYYCLRSVHGALGLQPQMHALYPLAPWLKTFKLLERATVTPDDYRTLARQGRLDLVWEDRFSKTLS
ncbi:MAG: YiiX/YebB-like N1pC/P60 family cysteine hydrolase [Rhodoferax sp.]|nr:YiiX/YebB-like N1pC/P60 family cysteine hydrolase [Rhodoferax sp.]